MSGRNHPDTTFRSHIPPPPKDQRQLPVNRKLRNELAPSQPFFLEVAKIVPADAILDPSSGAAANIDPTDRWVLVGYWVYRDKELPHEVATLLRWPETTITLVASDHKAAVPITSVTDVVSVLPFWEVGRDELFADYAIEYFFHHDRQVLERVRAPVGDEIKRAMQKRAVIDTGGHAELICRTLNQQQALLFQTTVREKWGHWNISQVPSRPGSYIKVPTMRSMSSAWPASVRAKFEVDGPDSHTMRVRG
eukprot:jgi/Mesvir1/5389/Mv15464-RA.1